MKIGHHRENRDTKLQMKVSNKVDENCEWVGFDFALGMTTVHTTVRTVVGERYGRIRRMGIRATMDTKMETCRDADDEQQQ